MPRSARSLQRYVEPAIGVAFLATWVGFESGRLEGPASTKLIVFGVTAIAIAVTRVNPWLAVFMSFALGALTLIGVIPPLDLTSWAAYFGIAIALTLSVIWGSPALRWVALAVGCTLSVALPLGVLPQSASAATYYPHPAWLGLTDWSTQQLGFYLYCSLASLVFFCAAWSISLVIRYLTALRRSHAMLVKITEELDSAEGELSEWEERNRIANEIHDVLGHSLAVIVAQAEGHRLNSAATRDETQLALQSIAEAGRAAMGDVRNLVEGFRDGPAGSSSPTLAGVAQLVAQVETAGLHLNYSAAGSVRLLSPIQELGAYRIVQESLTNALRHADLAKPASLHLEWNKSGLHIEVRSSVIERSMNIDSGPRVPIDTRKRRGLASMQQRAELLGGTFSASTTKKDAQFFTVRTFIPYRQPSKAKG